ncbi:fatty acid desaturase 6 [Petromyzon marinus]|uniref:Fatty acid desaturase 6 n=1 Tax=Petromyzon marinus TaxID=7757 RepID=A0AAJ7UC82_PETMA|nr:fatty acid desaturase 6 [Petromyzon marinus]
MRAGETGSGQGSGQGSLRELETLVSARIKSSPWLDRHGWDWLHLSLGFACLPAGLVLVSLDSSAALLLGCGCLAVTHALFTVKATHLASHNSLADSRLWSRVWCLFFIEVCGCFPADVAVEEHVKVHHAYTNVLGLGDSSTWRVPFLPRFVYLFLAPLALPFITPAVTLGLLLKRPASSWGSSVRTLALCALGLGAHFCWLRFACGFSSAATAAACMYTSRAAFAIPYIHVNVFQHLGLAMFARDSCPRRLVQMAHGVLNLHPVPVLDVCFGHSLISCHVEHHLFPTLSDHMCLQIKPLVSSYLKSCGQPYQEASYSNRLRLFVDKYDEFLVHLPPITDLAGLQ